MRKVVVNTTPLIALADIGQLDLLHQLYGEIMIPNAVIDEIESEPAKTLVANAHWIKKKHILHPERKSMFKSRLHSGEVEVIILAEEEEANLIIIDDNSAKKTAKFLGYNVTGTLGVLLKAKQECEIESVKTLLDMLSDKGFFIDNDIRDIVLKKAEE